MMRRHATGSLLFLLAGYAVGASAAEPVAVLRQPQGRAELDFEAQGAIWFDDLTIIRQG